MKFEELEKRVEIATEYYGNDFISIRNDNVTIVPSLRDYFSVKNPEKDVSHVYAKSPTAIIRRMDDLEDNIYVLYDEEYDEQIIIFTVTRNYDFPNAMKISSLHTRLPEYVCRSVHNFMKEYLETLNHENYNQIYQYILEQSENGRLYGHDFLTNGAKCHIYKIREYVGDVHDYVVTVWATRTTNNEMTVHIKFGEDDE